MSNIFFLIIVFFFNVSLANDKIAIIDTGIELNNVNPKKLAYNHVYHCYYSFNIASKENCINKDYYNHGTLVYKILEKKMPNNSILNYIYLNSELNNELLKYKYPSSLKDIYKRKQILTEIGVNITKSIEYAIRNNAKIINVSLAQRGIKFPELKEIIEKNPKVIFIFAAGNSNDNLDIEYNKTYPCSYKNKNTICVGSLKNNKKAEYSNYGKDVDVYITPYYEEGTSFSTPIITLEAFKLLKKGYDTKIIIEKIKEKYAKN